MRPLVYHVLHVRDLLWPVSLWCLCTTMLGFIEDYYVEGYKAFRSCVMMVCLPSLVWCVSLVSDCFYIAIDYVLGIIWEYSCCYFL